MRLLNLFLKASVVILASAVLFFPESPYFHGKVMLGRLVFFSAMMLLLPVLWLIGKKQHPYPHVADALFSLPFLFDVIGNDFGGYANLWWYDLVAHTFSPFIFGILFFVVALTITCSRKVSVLLSIGLMSFFHVVWEVGEYAFQSTAEGANLGVTLADSMEDLAMGILASLLIFLISYLPLWASQKVREDFSEPLAALFTKR